MHMKLLLFPPLLEPYQSVASLYFVGIQIFGTSHAWLVPTAWLVPKI